jgi:hypothetical protein
MTDTDTLIYGRRLNKSARYEKMMAARRQEEATLYLAAASALLNRIEAIDHERGRTCHEAVLSARADQAALLRRKDLPVTERMTLVMIGLTNLCHLMNLARDRATQKPLEIVGKPDPQDTHYGAARINVTWQIVEVRL